MNQKEKIKKLIEERSKLFDSEGEMLDEEEIDAYAKVIEKKLEVYIDILEPDFVLEAVTHLGWLPQLIYDDDGHWAVTEQGVSNVVDVFEEDYQQVSSVTDKKAWKDNIKDAVKYYILEYEKD